MNQSIAQKFLMSPESLGGICTLIKTQEMAIQTDESLPLSNDEKRANAMSDLMQPVLGKQRNKQPESLSSIMKINPAATEDQPVKAKRS